MWLASRLSLAGYSVWCDLEQLIGGEDDFWGVVQKVIDTRAAKFILVYSTNTFVKDGVKKEVSQAESISKEYKIKDFIIPIKIDNVPYNARIGINSKVIIDCQNDWHVGFSQLLKKLEKDKVIKNSKQASKYMRAYLIPFAEKDTLIERDETYYSNWLEISHFPPKYHAVKYALEKYAIGASAAFVDTPHIRQGNYIFCFDEKKIVLDSERKIGVKPETVKPIEIEDVLSGEIKSALFPGLKASRNLLVGLVDKTFEAYLMSKNMLPYPLANYSCYYFPKGTISGDKVKFVYKGKKSRPYNLVGKYYESFWHYAISNKAGLFPFPHVRLKYHLVFTTDGKTPWGDANELHAARRKKARNMWNKQWRSLLFALLFALSGGKRVLDIANSDSFQLILQATLKEFVAPVGYDDAGLPEEIEALDGQWWENE